MEDMPRNPTPHLHGERTRHGARVWYVRIGKGPRIRLREPYGTPAFWQAYRGAINGTPVSAPEKPKGGTLQWLWDRYRESQTWAALKASTRRQRENVMLRVLKDNGDVLIRDIDKAAIVAGRDRRAATPAAARHFVNGFRSLFTWAVEAGLAIGNPADGVKVMTPRTEGHETWTHDELARFEARWPRGTRERVAFDVLLYTGLRRGDAVRLGRPHVRDGVATIRTEKTGEVVSLMLYPPLVATLQAGPVGELTFIAGERGKPMTKEAFGNWFRKACLAAKVPGSAHGLRKAGATRAAEAGATEHELMALFGWASPQMARVYTKAASSRRLSMSGGAKVAARIANETDPHLVESAGATRKSEMKSGA